MNTIKFLSPLSLSEGKAENLVQITRTGQFTDPRYGQFEITADMLDAMVKNFEANTYGQDIFIDVAHKPENGAAGKVLALTHSNGRLLAHVEWTDYGRDAIKSRGYQYLSAEYHENWKDNETGQAHGPLLLGAALTVRPAIKRLEPIRLSEDGGHPVLLHPDLHHSFTEEVTTMLTTLLDKLRTRLGELKLAEAMISPLVLAFESAAKALGEDKGVLETLYRQFEETGKQLAESGKPTTLKIDLPDVKTLSADDINRLLDEREQKKAADAKKQADRLNANIALFDAEMAASDALKKLGEEARGKLLAARELINADMGEEQIKKLAAHQIGIGNDMLIATELAKRGFTRPAGTVQISVDESNTVKALQEQIDKRLGIAGLSDAQRYKKNGGQLPSENRALVEQVLEQYDAAHGAQLHREHKLLAAGDGIVTDVAVPAVFERTVIREALYDLVGLQFVNAGTLPFSLTAQIPYSYRDTTAAGRNSTRVYEGGAILRAGVKQAMDTAYPIPQKIAFEVSDELRFLTSNGQLQWDAVTENQRNASRIIQEDLEQMIANELLRSADEYSTTAVNAENLELQADDAKKVFILAGWPVVRPRKIYDLQGNQVGSTLYGVTVTYNGTARSEYDGTGTQADGIYYVLNYNLGEIYLVDELGAIQTPANGTAYTISYTYTTNVAKFDSDVGSLTTGGRWDAFLYSFGLRKSVIEDSRFYMTNFALMSGTLRTQIEQADSFEANSKRPGTDLMSDGNLGRIKDVPCSKIIAPSLNMGDVRVLLGERNQTRLRMMKPWSMEELENQRDSNGRFTGKKEAYGTQYLALHTPTPLKAATTTMVVYSAAGRVARAAP